MAYEVTATRKRPQQFDALMGQDFVKATITSAISKDTIAHAYLFSGPRGVGKTTSARLLAKALNCIHGPTTTPCGVCSNCKEITKGCSLDVIEIDGASNTSVNDIRTIKDDVQFPPQNSKYKIYIIDEVHMLSTSAFNALLKTIEEPPEYVIFIFATTETNKVPATIRSRCQQFNFQLLPLETIKTLLKEASADINIQSDEDALFWIAKEATGSMRDAYTLFDQVVAFSDDHITMEKIKNKLGLTGTDSLNDIMEFVIKEDSKNAILATTKLLDRGVSIEQLIKDFAQYFRCLLLIDNNIDNEAVLGEDKNNFSKKVILAYSKRQKEEALDQFLTLYRDIRYSLNPRFEIELAISRLCALKYFSTPSLLAEQIARLKNDLINGKITPLNPVYQNTKDIEPAKTIEVKQETVKTESVIVPETKKEKPKQIKNDLEINLSNLIDAIHQNLPKLNIAIKQTERLVETKEQIIFYFKTEFARKNLEINSLDLKNVLATYFNCNKQLKFVVETKKDNIKETLQFDETEKRIQRILGGRIKQ